MAACYDVPYRLSAAAIPFEIDMAVPDYESLMLPVLRLAAAQEVSIRECIARLATELNLSEEDLKQLLPSRKQTRFANRVHWAKSYLVQAGLLEMTKRAHFRASQRGLGVLAEKPARINNDFLLRYQEFRDFRNRRRAEGGASPGGKSDIATANVLQSTPEEIIEAAYTEITDELRSELLARILQSSPAFFERVIIDLLIAMGYGGSRAGAGERVGRAYDGGIDGIINEDPLGLDIVYLQAKRYAPGNVVGVDKVREFAGSLVERGASKGVFVTTSHFAPAAQAYPSRIPQRLILIDGAELTRLMVRYGVGVRVERTIEFKRLDSDYFDEEQTV